MSFAVGANDAANSLGTLFGSKALKLTYIVLLGALFEFVGSVWCSGHIASQLIPRLIIGIEQEDADYITRQMLGASISSFLFIMSSSVFGMPISGTHAVIGGLVGAGIIGSGFASIGWMQVFKIVISWVLSPLLSAFLCSALLVIVSVFTLGGINFSLKVKLIGLSLIYAFCFGLTNFMFIRLIQDKEDVPGVEYLTILFTSLAGLLSCRL